MAKATPTSKRRISTMARPTPNPVSRNTVTVACKLPHGLILRLFRVEDYREQGRDGNLQAAKRAVEIEGTRVVINGANSNLGAEPKMPVAVAYALTHNVPADIWDAWLAENRESDMVRNGLIFAHEKPAYADDKTREQKGIRTGFEPIDQAHPERHVRGVEPGARVAA